MSPTESRTHFQLIQIFIFNLEKQKIFILQTARKPGVDKHIPKHPVANQTN
jgi:hypothetical protein